jgi:lysyl-tRNA synthetase class 2
MSSLEELQQERRRKLALLEAAGVPAYPDTSHRTHTLEEARNDFAALTENNHVITIAGRVLGLREHGGSVFLDLYDGSAQIQGWLKRDEIGEDLFDLFIATVDVGDFLELAGTLMRTKRGEESLLVNSWRMLAKSLRPLPEKWQGLRDTEERLRKRYLDILIDPTTRELFVQKAKFWQSVRNFMVARDFLEVETPVLETTTGGADARPFETHHQALDVDVYLRISAGELWQKKLMVAGYPKVFEIGRIFRNEGISAEHAQDYTQMEFYWAYANYRDGMKLVEELYKHVAQETFGTLEFTIGEHQVNLANEWVEYDYTDTIRKQTGIDISTATLALIETKLDELGVEHRESGFNRIRAIDKLWKYCRAQISGPGFLVNVPRELSPLAKRQPGNPDLVEQFQPLIAGSELGKGYSELNDPIDQAARFARQQELRNAGDEEAQMYAHDFVEALEYGMPPTCGFGMSERVFSFLANRPIRETQIFPLMRPRLE